MPKSLKLLRTGKMQQRDIPHTLSQAIGDLAPGILSAGDLEFCQSAEDVLTAADAQSGRWDSAARTRFRTARQEGFDKGYAKGLADVLAGFVDTQTRAAQIRDEYEQALNALVVVAMERFFGTAPQNELLMRSVYQALDTLALETVPALAANPDDIDELRKECETEARSLEIVPDPNLPIGEVCLRSDVGEVRISLARHLHMLRQALDEPEPQEAIDE